MLGAGLMGAGIAEVSMAKGFTVSMVDKFEKGLQNGFKQIKGNMDKKVGGQRCESCMGSSEEEVMRIAFMHHTTTKMIHYQD